MKTKQIAKAALFLIAVKLALVYSLPCYAQENQYIEVGRVDLSEALRLRGEWQSVAYQAKAPRSEGTPAKLCFLNGGTNQGCFKAEVTLEPNRKYQFAYVKRLFAIPLFEKREPRFGLIFVSEFSAGGSGSLKLITIWAYDENEMKFANILPIITISEQGEYKILSTASDRAEKAFVFADYIWGHGETHFDSHRYRIRIYQYNSKKKIFALTGQYVTNSKYPSLNDVDKIDVIEPEMKNIREHLLSRR